ncbi:unnamed protein product [Notodromas monacha]|uniref:Ionotropic glutamate receptor C-terminal domain-containing protein n=1 Tax=Notodromas monacha TaxID=399045 RepID=A0A7R9C349_9CRUS|nr:unnamed protein product [Notodromas monacha]CAG0924904.1 unnamed protein product [Notodromas monacha]
MVHTDFILSHWYQMGQQAISVRLLTFFWWIFSIVLVAIYVSMVAEKYTTLHYATRIKTWKDMINQDYVQVGLVRGGSTESFFKSSTVPEIKLMWEKMQKHPDWLATSLADGIQRVRDGNGRYAFFAETLSVDYLIHRECDLVKIGPELGQRSYGFALQKKSLYTHAISAAILRLQEQGAVQALYTKWWHDTTSENCDRKSDEDRRVDAIDAGHLRGIFVPVIIVAFLAMFVALVELVWTCIWRGDLSKPFSTRLRMELQQIIGFNVPISRQGLRNEFEQ